MTNNISADIREDPSSYRDPSGKVFYYNDRVLRYLDNASYNTLAEFLQSRIAKELIEKKILVHTEFIDPKTLPPIIKDRFGTNILEHEVIEFITYCYEWTPSMLSDAALLILDIQKRLLLNGYTLKDATAYNVQFLKGKPIWIDIPSIIKFDGSPIWSAYNQFCMFFLYPLILYSCQGIDYKSLFLSDIEGLSFDKLHKMLSLKIKFNIKFFIDITLPKLLLSINSNKKYSHNKNGKDNILKHIEINKNAQLYTISRLESIIKKLKLNKNRSHWLSYVENHSYSNDEIENKKRFVEKFFQENRCGKVLDVGGNTGQFSELAEKYGNAVVVIDSALDCMDKLFIKAKQNTLNILPLYLDITNPSPSVGWRNTERKSFIKRANFDCVIALAIIHHLMVTSRIPLESIVDFFSKITKKYLILEYVAKTDSMFSELLINKEDIYSFFTEEYFRNTIKRRFRVINELNIKGSDRIIFALEVIPTEAE